MKKNILAISTSLRKDSNSEILLDQFICGAKEAGHQVKKISLKGKKIDFCKGCLACQKTGRCVIKDDGDSIAQEMKQADVIVFATPIYYYEMCGQMKTLLDRANPLFASEYSFRDIYVLLTAADSEEKTPDRAISGLEGWITCFEKAQLKEAIFAGGVDGVGEIKGNPMLEKAYETGKNIE